MLIYTHPDSAGHVTPQGHPERAERLGAVARALHGIAAQHLQMPLADETDILRAHTPDYLAKLKAAAPRKPGWAQIDGDTFMSQGTLQAALRGVGGACAAVDAVLTGPDPRAFVAARPPGHHATRSQAMGFCLFSNVAIAALRAIHHHGLSRVAIVDFDVHHGNGTQDVLWGEPACLFLSSHQMPLYPGTGSRDETGSYGQIVNVPLHAGGGSAAMRAAYSDIILPRLRSYAPALVLISAGFDAHRDDPLGGLGWQTQDYAWVTQQLCDIADDTAKGRVVSCLEGGYDLPALEAALHAHITAMQPQKANDLGESRG